MTSSSDINHDFNAKHPTTHANDRVLSSLAYLAGGDVRPLEMIIPHSAPR